MTCGGLPGSFSSMTRIICRQDEEGFLQKNASSVSCRKRVLPCSTQPLPYGACRTTPRISFWEVVQTPRDVPALLHRIPQCKAIVTTGEKATDTLCTQFSIDKPKVGDFTEFFSKPSDAPLPDAFFLKSLPAGTGKKSSSVSHYVSGLTDVVSNFLYKISTSVTCIFESLHYLCSRKHGSSSVGRAPVSKTGCREFEPLLPCMNE